MNNPVDLLRDSPCGNFTFSRRIRIIVLKGKSSVTNLKARIPIDQMAADSGSKLVTPAVKASGGLYSKVPVKEKCKQ